MLFAIEIDNSQINFGLFDEKESMKLIKNFKLTTDLKKSSDEYAVTVSGMLSYYGIDTSLIDGVAVGSVVPQLTDVILTVIKSITNVNVVIVGKGTKTGFPIKIDNPADLGADLVANAAAVIDIKKTENKKTSPCVIIDMGTATTIFAINSNGEYIGGSILPGVGISLDVLHGRTAMLPNVTPLAPTHAIGKNSQESVRSGVILGNALMIDGFIRKFAEEMRCGDGVEVFVTGEYAQAVIPFCEHDMRYYPELTLLGFCCIYKNNIKP